MTRKTVRQIEMIRSNMDNHNAQIVLQLHTEEVNKFISELYKNASKIVGDSVYTNHGAEILDIEIKNEYQVAASSSNGVCKEFIITTIMYNMIKES